MVISRALRPFKLNFAWCNALISGLSNKTYKVLLDKPEIFDLHEILVWNQISDYLGGLD